MTSLGPEPTQERAAVLAAVADLVPVVERPVLVGIDGPDGAGKTWFADELAREFTRRRRAVARASVDGFHHPREYRHREGRTAETIWSRHFDYRALHRDLIDPWLAGAGASYRIACHDLLTDAQLDPPAEIVPGRAVLLVDGLFLQRPELVDVWDLVVFLDAPVAVRASRLAEREGTADDPDHPDQRRYVESQERYAELVGPRERADVVIDNADPERPGLRLRGADVVPGSVPIPDGWRVDGDTLVREVRLPTAAAEVAVEVDLLTKSAWQSTVGHGNLPDPSL